MAQPGQDVNIPMEHINAWWQSGCGEVWKAGNCLGWKRSLKSLSQTGKDL